MIPVGKMFVGFAPLLPIVGERFLVYTNIDYVFFYSTSEVKKFVIERQSDNLKSWTIETKNSVYLFSKVRKTRVKRVFRIIPQKCEHILVPQKFVAKRYAEEKAIESGVRNEDTYNAYFQDMMSQPAQCLNWLRCNMGWNDVSKYVNQSIKEKPEWRTALFEILNEPEDNIN